MPLNNSSASVGRCYVVVWPCFSHAALFVLRLCSAYNSGTTTAYTSSHHHTETDSSGAPLLLWRSPRVLWPTGKQRRLFLGGGFLLLLNGAPFYPQWPYFALLVWLFFFWQSAMLWIFCLFVFVAVARCPAQRLFLRQRQSKLMCILYSV